MGSDLAQAATIALSTLRATALGALLSISIGFGFDTELSGDHPSDERVRVDSFSRRMHDVMEQHHCSTTGFDPSSQPSTALIRTELGRLRVVTFEAGWDVFTGKRPGTLVAVCLDRTKVSRAT